MKQLIPLANKGDTNAQRRLGLISELGQGVPQNIETAMAWYNKSAAQQYPAAQAKVNAEAKAAARAVSAQLDCWDKVNTKREVEAKAKTDAQASNSDSPLKLKQRHALNQWKLKPPLPHPKIWLTSGVRCIPIKRLRDRLKATDSVRQ